MSLRRIHRRLLIEDLEPRNNLAEDYILANDIDASATSTWNVGLGFDPVGNDSNPFRGSFDGQGHIIMASTSTVPPRTSWACLDTPRPG